MKIKDLKGNLGGVKVKTPKGVIGYWKSQWGYPDGKAGVWLSTKPHGTGQVYPQFVDSLKDCLEWEVAGEKEKVNCDVKTDYTTIDNVKE